MKIFFYSIFLFLSVCGQVVAQSKIQTIQCYPVGKPFAEPIIILGSGQQLYFGFDDLSPDVNTYSYRIQHCDPDWKNSNLSPFNYLTGFFSNPLNDYNYSTNSGTVQYTRFSLLLPNSDVSIKLSGNYLLQIFNDENPDSAVVAQRFSVLENKVGITATLSNSPNPATLYTSQQLNFTVNYESLPVYNPMRDVKAYVTRNQDPNSRRDFVPTFVRQGQLVYGDGTNNIFNGLSPFRNFSCTSLVYYTQYVKDVVKGPEGMYNFILQPGTVPTAYTPIANQYGNFYIQAENTQDPELGADYVIVHFAIYSEPIPDADVYVYGKFSRWQLLPELKMDYDFKNKAYTGQAELKQGNYDYMYGVVPKDKRTPDLVTLQNNFYQTPNEYNIRFYFYDTNLGYFRFVGYQTVQRN